MNEEQKNPDEVVDIDAIPDSEMKMPAGSIDPTTEKSSMGIILGVLIVVLVLILGGLYLWGTTLQQAAPAPTPVERPTAEENNEPESENAEADVETLETVSSSDEIAAIEADLDATDLDALDAELQAIEAELNAAFGVPEAETN